jgi:hypothetical protein
MVMMSADEVQFGELPASTFSFAIHSPGRAGLEIGGVYTIEAKWNGDGYVLDELRNEGVRSAIEMLAGTCGPARRIRIACRPAAIV